MDHVTRIGEPESKPYVGQRQRKMKEVGVTYVQMVDRLKAHGFEETEASLTMKLKRDVCGDIFDGLHRSLRARGAKKKSFSGLG